MDFAMQDNVTITSFPAAVRPKQQLANAYWIVLCMSLDSHYPSNQLHEHGRLSLAARTCFFMLPLSAVQLMSVASYSSLH